MALTIFSNPLFVEAILPFLLVFTLVFAILQKTKVLGDGKKQIDAIVAGVIGLIVISFSYATGIIISIIPFLAVAAVVILIFMLLYGMTFASGKFEMHWGIQTAIGIILAIGIIVTVMIATGAWDYIVGVLNTGADKSAIITNLVFIGLFVAAVAAVLAGGGKGKDEKKDK